MYDDSVDSDFTEVGMHASMDDEDILVPPELVREIGYHKWLCGFGVLEQHIKSRDDEYVVPTEYYGYECIDDDGEIRNDMVRMLDYKKIRRRWLVVNKFWGIGIIPWTFILCESQKGDIWQISIYGVKIKRCKRFDII